MRAMAFERLIRHERFVSQLLTSTVGRLQLSRPDAVWRADGKVATDVTAQVLAEAHHKAVTDNVATMVTSLAVPFVGMEGVDGATPVKPDFCIVVPRRTDGAPEDDTMPVIGSWLVMGDAKDYERVRSRIDDQRMLKGFLQVALGAESAAEWSLLPDGMTVHRWGALAVPKNAFLQPEAEVELLDDHRREVRARVDERAGLLAERGGVAVEDVEEFVRGIPATFEPGTCSACALFNYCRTELRGCGDNTALLTEVGVRPELRPAVLGVLEGSVASDAIPASVLAGIRATIDGQPVWTGQRRVDPVGLPGSVDVVLAKSDAAALGIHGLGLRRVGTKGKPSAWKFHVFEDPQASATRLQVMDLIGAEIQAALAANPDEPVCLVVPDAPSADVLVSMADSLAGVETSRLRWERDREMGRPALTFDGEPAVVPAPLTETQRVAVSFLLEEDRARAMSLRWAIVDLRRVLSAHVVAGGPGVDSGRLDYLVTWAEATTPLDHRDVADAVTSRVHTPGARLSNARSDEVHVALKGKHGRKGKSGAPDLPRYNVLIKEELQYKADIMGLAVALLDGLPLSALRTAHLAIERDAQTVWRRRLRLHASDLVRFGRTHRLWRNKQVEMIETDAACAAQLTCLGNPQAARDMAIAAGTREVALATVLSVDPLRVNVCSRRIVTGSAVAVLHLNGHPLIEEPSVALSVLKGSFKFSQTHLGPLVDDGGAGLRLDLGVPLAVATGDELILGDLSWFKSYASNHQMGIERAGLDTQNAPKDDCEVDSYADDPDWHTWCCRSHEDAEAEWSDVLAGRRARGELNPEVWPPVIDEDQFDAVAEGSPTDAGVAASDPRPDHLTIDDLD